MKRLPVPTNHSKPIRTSAKESAFNQIQQWIIDGTLHPGEKLNDTELAKALGISRTPVRESLQLLEMQGFVKMYPGKATQVTEVEKDSITDLLPPLAALQALSAELAIPFITDEIIDSLKYINERFAKAVHSENYFSALKIDEEFHQLIVDTANNPYILAPIAFFQTHVRRLFFHNSVVLTEASIDKHDQIIKCLMNKDATNASSMMRENWLRAIDEFHSMKMKH